MSGAVIIPFPPAVHWIRAVGGSLSHALTWSGESWDPVCGHVGPGRRGA